MNRPLVSICTPTWGRHDMLMDRCVPSVQAQTYPAVEHVIVSDGPDEKLRGIMTAAAASHTWRHPVIYAELPEHLPDPNFGHYARRHAVDLAAGEYIGYNDDDDFLRPQHCALMAAALDDNPGAGFAVSRMLSHYPGDQLLVIGWGPLSCGNVGTPMIVHRRETLQHGTWEPASRLEDWEVVEKWLKAGIKYANVNYETADVYPSTFR